MPMRSWSQKKQRTLHLTPLPASVVEPALPPAQMQPPRCSPPQRSVTSTRFPRVSCNASGPVRSARNAGQAHSPSRCSAASFSVQPNLANQFRSHPRGVIFPVLAVAGMIGTRLFSFRRKELQAFLALGLYLLGMLTSAAFGVIPNVLPSNTTPNLGLTIHNAATSEQGQIVGLSWFIPGMALATGYSVFAYRHFAGKVQQGASPDGALGDVG